jgi:hypothetical protein
MSQDVSPAQVSMVRGVKNCGKHHEENKISPAVGFVQECDGCAAHIFAVIYNAGVEAEAQDAARVVRAMMGR